MPRREEQECEQQQRTQAAVEPVAEPRRPFTTGQRARRDDDRVNRVPGRGDVERGEETERAERPPDRIGRTAQRNDEPDDRGREQGDELEDIAYRERAIGPIEATDGPAAEHESGGHQEHRQEGERDRAVSGSHAGSVPGRASQKRYETWPGPAAS